MSLITPADISAKRDLSSNRKNIRYQQHIDDAQYIDVRPLLGRRLYLDLVANFGDQKYQNILNEFDYVYDNFTYTHPGLKSVLINFAYSRILFFTEVDTPFGLVEKNYQDAVKPSRERSKSRYTDMRKTAIIEWEEVKLYIERNIDIYQFWCDDINALPKKLGYKIKHIR
jgi:hypothetical protein